MPTARKLTSQGCGKQSHPRTIRGFPIELASVAALLGDPVSFVPFRAASSIDGSGGPRHRRDQLMMFLKFRYRLAVESL